MRWWMMMERIPASLASDTIASAIEQGGIETQSGISIPITEDSRKRLDLFTVSSGDGAAFPYASQFGIKTEVDEHGILVLMPFLKCFFRDLGGYTQADDASMMKVSNFFHDCN